MWGYALLSKYTGWLCVSINLIIFQYLRTAFFGLYKLLMQLWIYLQLWGYTAEGRRLFWKYIYISDKNMKFMTVYWSWTTSVVYQDGSTWLPTWGRGLSWLCHWKTEETWLRRLHQGKYNILESLHRLLREHSLS